MARSDSKSGPKVPGPDFSHETTAMGNGAARVAGVDEAGRGPLAGPVVAAAVILDPRNIPEGLNDSKKLSEKKREAVFRAIMASAEVGFCAAPAQVIDALNIRGATLWAMEQAVCALPRLPDLALIDGNDVPKGLACRGSYLIGGDGLSVSIAAASIVAKVVRDHMCAVMDCGHPAFGFAKHKGYGTAVHMAALTSLGPTELHRMSFAPVMAARQD